MSIIFQNKDPFQDGHPASLTCSSKSLTICSVAGTASQPRALRNPRGTAPQTLTRGLPERRGTCQTCVLPLAAAHQAPLAPATLGLSPILQQDVLCQGPTAPTDTPCPSSARGGPHVTIPRLKPGQARSTYLASVTSQEMLVVTRPTPFPDGPNRTIHSSILRRFSECSPCAR